MKRKSKEYPILVLLIIGFIVSLLHAQTSTAPSIADTKSSTFERQKQYLEKEGWAKQAKILARINPPSFPDRDFNITTFGAVGDGKTNCFDALKKAINVCSKAGGGRIVIPRGNFLSNGPIHLKSRVNLHLEQGATILFGTNPLDYTPLVLVRWEGTVCYNYSPLIYARGQKDIAITGKGTLNGQTTGTWSKWKRGNDGKNQNADKKVLRQKGNDVTPIEERVFGHGFLDLDNDGKDDGFGDGQDHYLRPTLVEFYECENILIEGVTLKESPFWTVHPTFCKNVTIRNLNVQQGTTNDDGIDPDSCTDVLIENCIINTADDAIAIKAGRDNDAWIRPPCENIIIRNCTSLNTHTNGICIGSEMLGSVRNVFVSDCDMGQVGNGFNFKCNLDRGGTVENIYIRDVSINSCSNNMFMFTMAYHSWRGNNYPTKFNDFYVSNIKCQESKGTSIEIIGVETEHVKRVSLRNVTVEKAEKDHVIKFADDIVADKVSINGQAFDWR